MMEVLIWRFKDRKISQATAYFFLACSLVMSCGRALDSDPTPQHDHFSDRNSFAELTRAATPTTPFGSLGLINKSTKKLFGWALDPQAPATAMHVDLYADGPAGVGTFIVRVLANLPRPDVNAVYPAYRGNYGYEFGIPAAYLDSKPHTFYAYAMHAGGTGHTHLANSPRAATLSPLIGSLAGYTAAGLITGWALDKDAPSQQLSVRFYLDGPAGSGTFLGAATANQVSPPVPPAVGVGGSHGFQFQVPLQYIDGKVHALYAEVIHSSITGGTPLASSPRVLSLNVTQEVWTHPNGGSAFVFNPWDKTAQNQLGIFKRESEWSTVLAQTDVFQFFIGSLNEPVLTDSDLLAALDLFKRQHIKIAVELGGLLQWSCDANTGGAKNQAGEYSARFELSKLARIYQAGGEVAYLSMDSPIGRVLKGGRPNGCQLSLDEAIIELVDYMRIVKAAHPKIEFGLITNFPNDVYDGTPPYFRLKSSKPGTPGYKPSHHADIDYRVVLDKVVRRTRTAGQNIRYLHCDNPYRYATGELALDKTVDYQKRIADLQIQAASLNLRFGQVFNSYRVPGTPNLDQAFQNDTVAFIKAFARYGQPVNSFVVESWYAYPSKMLPENQPYTFMNTMLKAIAAKP